MSVYKSLEVQFNMLLHSIYDFPIVPNNKQMFIGTWNIFVQISYYHQADLWSPHLPPQTHTRPYPGSIRWVKDDNYHIASSQKRCKTSKMDWGARFFFQPREATTKTELDWLNAFWHILITDGQPEVQNAK